MVYRADCNGSSGNMALYCREIEIQKYNIPNRRSGVEREMYDCENREFVEIVRDRYDWPLKGHSFSLPEDVWWFRRR